MANTSPHSDDQTVNNVTHISSEIQALRDFAELSSDWFWEQDAEFRFIRFYGLSTEKLRRKQSDFFGKRRWDMPISGITEEQLAEHIAAYERHEPFRDFDYEVPGEGGVTVYYSVSGAPVFDDQGVFVGYHGVGRNMTELRLAELAIKESERQLSQIVDGSSIATFVIDADHRITHWNRACAILTGINAWQMLGAVDVWRAFYSSSRPCLADMVVDETSEESIARQYPEFIRSTLITGAIEAEDFFPHMGKDGRWLYFTAAPLRDSEGKITGAIETLQDITDQRKTQAALEQLASRDGLTGISNRRHFDEILEKEWKRAQRSSLTLVLLMIDVDHFKLFNDTYGHQAGDLCLQQIAGVLEKAVYRPGDLVARYGGEEFAVILTSTDAEGAKTVARRILDYVAELAIPHNDGEDGRVTLSIGISNSLPQPGMAQKSLISEADSALYQAKSAGRNRFIVSNRITESAQACSSPPT